MEEGSLRCDANVSVTPRGQKKFGTKAEVKNVNRFRFIRDALEYEIERQIEVIESGGRVMQETRLWNAHEGKHLHHALEGAGARLPLLPEPDLPPLVVDDGVAERNSQALAGVAGGAPQAHGRRVRHHASRTRRRSRPRASRSPTSSKRRPRRRRIPSAWPTWCTAN